MDSEEPRRAIHPPHEVLSLLLAETIDDQTLCCFEDSEEWQPFEKVRSAILAEVKQIPEEKQPVRTGKSVPAGTKSTGGKESHLQLLGSVFAVLGIVGAVFCFAQASDVGSSLEPFLIALGILSALNGVAAYILLSAGAEVIRLLKKLNGLKFDGIITQPDSIQVYKCSVCDWRVANDATGCPRCGALFVDELPDGS